MSVKINIDQEKKAPEPQENTIKIEIIEKDRIEFKLNLKKL